MNWQSKDFKIDLLHLLIEEVSDIDAEENNENCIILLNSHMNADELTKIFNLTKKYEINKRFRELKDMIEISSKAIKQAIFGNYYY